MRAASIDHANERNQRPAAVELTAGDLSQRLSRILAMPPDELAVVWARHCRGKSSPGLPRSILARLLVYRIQADALGDLSPDVRRFLDRVSKEIAAGHEKPDLQFADQFRLKPGTVLVREHGGVEHRVMVLADGFAWNGQVHNSLSAVASAITGTRWNGHRFFGLNNAGRADITNPRKERGPVSADLHGRTGRTKAESRAAGPADARAPGDAT